MYIADQLKLLRSLLCHLYLNLHLPIISEVKKAMHVFRKLRTKRQRNRQRLRYVFGFAFVSCLRKSILNKDGIAIIQNTLEAVTLS